MTKKAAAKLKSFNSWIIIKGAREHNLKNIDVNIPKNTLTIITGPSGSGKSSLALDILYTEGKRRYMESLSSYARQFLGIAKKPDVDSIEGLCPAVAIEQKTVGSNPRSTVGTITEIYDYLRVLFARIGSAACPQCHIPIQAESPQNIAQLVESNFKNQHIMITAPLAIEKKGEFANQLKIFFQKGYRRFIIDGKMEKFLHEDDIKALKLGKTYRHSIDLILDSLEVVPEEQSRIQDAIEKAFQLAQNFCRIIDGDQKPHLYSSHRICLQCALSFPEMEPRLFSFNSPIGACGECNGLGLANTWMLSSATDLAEWSSSFGDNPYSRLLNRTCMACHGKRLNPFALAVTLQGKNIYDLGELSITHALQFLKSLSLDTTQTFIAQPLIREINNRLGFLNDVGLSYLSLNRSARTISGGEGQRIRLATQIGSALSGVLYVLDEPSIGLHQRDNDRLIETLKKLRDQGNTVLVVEHDIDTMLQADYLIDMGPAAGVLGGNIVAIGTPQEVAHNPDSLTGRYLSGRNCIPIPPKLRQPTGFLTLTHVTQNNLKDVSVNIPLGTLCCISGVSGSGKSTLILEILVPALQYALTHRWQETELPEAQANYGIAGTKNIRNLVVIDQAPIGRTPRSNPATYLGIFDLIRKLYASLPESNALGYTIGRFSFNVADGRCQECKGEGTVTVSMQFLADVIMTCKVCKGKRYSREVLAITYKEKNIADVLAMTALEAATFFEHHPPIAKRLKLLCEVGLDYLQLGQPSTTLSGGEAQRIKLVDELAKRGDQTLYVLDEPTTGLHSNDIEKLLHVFHRLINKGNSMIIIEHNIDVLKGADYLIDMGPEGGDEGGHIIAQGTPQEVAQSPISHTGKYLKKALKEAKKK